MTNEEAFEKWYRNDSTQLLVHSAETYHTSKESWEAAIAYMQEQSEPVTYLKFYSHEHGLDRWEGFEEVSKNTDGSFPVYTTPQRQQPLKRLSEDRIDEIFNSYSDEQGYVAIDDWHLLTNAIMSEMERINK